jgi:hypothetical protein
VFVLRNAPAAALGPPREAYEREVEWAGGQLRLAPHNESAWEALRGLAAGGGGLAAPRRALAADPRYLELCREVLVAFPACAPALSLLADVFLEQGALLEEAAAGGGGADPAAARAGAAAARRLAREVLGRQLVADPIRRPYLRARLAALAAEAEGGK